MKKLINWMIAFFSLLIVIILAFGVDAPKLWIFLGIAFSLLHVVLAIRKEPEENAAANGRYSNVPVLPGTALTEVVLLGEDDSRLASWSIYGKNGIVIGRDVGENNVSINLDNSVYASMIDIEHAVLNYSADNWYIEDISEKNGVSIQKEDGRKYRLAYGKPCKLEKGDIIYIALTRLQIL